MFFLFNRKNFRLFWILCLFHVDVYKRQTYLNSFKNEDGSVNWLPVCADAHGFVVNRSLFEQYDIPLPTDRCV